MKPVTIGNGCGFWGDNLDAPVRLVDSFRLDYLTLEYLAELTMSILALLRQRDPQTGYAHDFLDVLKRLVPALKEQSGLKIVTNAGGMNPQSCAVNTRKLLFENGLTDRKVGIVSGDDLLPQLDQHIEKGHLLRHLDTGASVETIRDRIVSANAYLGAQPISTALHLGASIVITGRVADASLTVGPLAHEFGWKWDQEHVDRLAAGTTAGHLIECGAQVAGGLWINAEDSTRLEDVGYPIVQFEEDGTFQITKPRGSGGAVNFETVSEQLLYEVADPAAYYSPDVIADFTAPQLREREKDIVEVRKCRGQPASDLYKVSIAYRDGYSAAGTLVIAGPNAVHKAHCSGAILLDRLKQIGITFDKTHIEAIGSGACTPGVRSQAEPNEVVLRVAVRDPRKGAVERFTKEFAPLVTAGFAGTTGYTTGRAAVREVFAYWPALIAKSAVEPRVEVLD